MDALRESKAIHSKVYQVSEELQKLTAQLNQFKPASVQTMGEVQNKVSEDFQQRLLAQNERIDKLSESLNQSQKTVQDTAELVQTILVGMENLGENFKQLQENMDYWHMPENPNAETEHQKLNEELLREVSLLVPITSRAVCACVYRCRLPEIFACNLHKHGRRTKLGLGRATERTCGYR